MFGPSMPVEQQCLPQPTMNRDLAEREKQTWIYLFHPIHILIQNISALKQSDTNSHQKPSTLQIQVMFLVQVNTYF